MHLARQQLNEDVVFEVMLYLGVKDQATAAQLARLWTRPAQKVLYRSITFHTWDKAPKSSGQRLVESLRSHPHLRALVQQISIHASDDGSSQLDWVDLFINHSLRNFTYVCWPRTVFVPALLQKDFIRRIPHLTLNGPMVPRALRACFELPMVETLEIDLSEWDAGRDRKLRWVLEGNLQLRATKMPNLKHLYLHVPRIRDHVVSVVVAAFAAQLHSLHIHIPPAQIYDFKMDAKAAWTEEFVGHIRAAKNLTRLVISGFHQWLMLLTLSGGSTDLFDMRLDFALEQVIYGPLRRKQHLHPFLDGVAERSAVEHLCCIDGSYSDELFRKLSRRIKVLEFYFDEEKFEREGALLDMLGRLGKDRLGLRALRFFACEERRPLFGAIEAACRENGVNFEFVPVVPPLHQPPSRPAIVWD